MTSRTLMMTSLAAVLLVMSFGLISLAEAENEPRAEEKPDNQLVPLDRQQRDEFPGQPAYEASLARAERAYVAAVEKARQKYVADIRDLQMRASMLPEASQALDAEVKRISSLPRPVVIPEPKADPAANAEKQTLKVHIQAPSGLWSISIQEVRRVGDELWVLSQLNQSDGMGIMMIIDAVDTVEVTAPKLTVRHFILGKTWNWGEADESTKFINAKSELGPKWQAAQPLKLTRP